MIEWSRIQALTFDCFGTLVDWEKGILSDLKNGLTTRSGKDPSTYYDDDELLRFYGQAEPAAQGTPFKPYREVLKIALMRVAESGHLKVKGEPDLLVRSLPGWPLFADVPDALARLKKRFKLALVTNCDRDLVAQVAPRLGVELDATVTSEHVGAYKPSPKLLEEALKQLGVPKEGLVHVAQSLFHDVEPARALGIACVHVDRREGRPGGATPRPTTNVSADLKVKNLAELCSLTGV
jgi:2-haloalkanoic acid dehalogenase type II